MLERSIQPVTVAEAVKRVENHRWVLPGIQRSFVWRRDQICRLFDSLLADFPIGTVLLWRANPQGRVKLGFRYFLNEVEAHQEPGPPVNLAHQKSAIAVLDGQQRLTALYSGLRGSYLVRGEPHRLSIDLSVHNVDAAGDDMRFGFKYRKQLPNDEPNVVWVSDLFGLTPTRAIEYSQAAGIKGEARARLKRLARVINSEAAVSLQLETSDDLERILGIFARTNKGGTTLTYVDLLLSVATAAWGDEDAAFTVKKLRQQLNETEPCFRFSADRIIKAGLVVVGEKEPKFKASTFKATTGTKLHTNWDAIADALQLSVDLLSSFGLSGRSIPAQNVLIPVVSYAYTQQLKRSYLKFHNRADDRDRIRAFVVRTLLKPRYWTGAVDPILVTAHRVIAKHGAEGFPLDELTEELRRIRRPIEFTEDEIEDLLDTTYGKPQAYLLLRVLYPDVPEVELLHKDHVFPRRAFSEGYLRQHKVAPTMHAHWPRLAETLPNLQLLTVHENVLEKNGVLPHKWLKSPGLPARVKKMARDQDVTKVPTHLADFEVFYEHRRALMRERLKALLAHA